ncbi:hypothetical protein AcV5_009867 [Taiwanofungus camphoratus]|nr:hypothetical protein AcV5_009867 [Antrodia cinnamomea]
MLQSVGSCIESVAGIFQLTLQWALFTIILVLYMIYFPPHLKYAAVALDVDTGADTHDSRPPRAKASIKSDAWRLSIILSWVVFLHIALITFVTFLLLSNFAPSPGPDSPHEQRVHAWATFLGVTSALLAALQYAPQLVHTAKLRLVGALSVPMMLIQSPGAVVMVLSIALRPGTNWTTWLPYAVAGVMQGSLLIMCLFWRARQARLGIDDFGNPIVPSQPGSLVPVIRGPDEGAPVEVAVEEAVETDVRSIAEGGETSEETPLLKRNGVEGKAGTGVGGLFWWLKWTR